MSCHSVVPGAGKNTGHSLQGLQGKATGELAQVHPASGLQGAWWLGAPLPLLYPALLSSEILAFISFFYNNNL